MTRVMEEAVDLGLVGKTALVFGGGGGLGGAVARALAGEGAAIAVADIDQVAAAVTADTITSAGGRALAITWDIGDLERIAPNMERIENDLGPVDIQFNNTGGPPPTPAARQYEALWSSSFQSMVLSVIKITDAALPGMRARGWGRIITSASSGVVAPIPNLGVSNTLRSALVGWSKTLAREVARDGITVNVMVPGRIATPRVAALDHAKAAREGRSVVDVAAESEGSIPIGRYGQPEEYAAVAAFLASTKASYVTGSMIRVDGGLIANV